MIHTDLRVRFCTALLTANLLFIWGNSLLPAEVSQAISDAVKELLALLLPGDGLSGGTGRGLVRKIAHFLEFASLGMLSCWLAGMKKKPVLMALAGCFLVACVDETIQLFIPGRGPGLWDVALDTCGSAAGIALLLLGHSVRKTRINDTFLEDN